MSESMAALWEMNLQLICEIAEHQLAINGLKTRLQMVQDAYYHLYDDDEKRTRPE